jgi:ubiquinone/menaquinone biosynthesis C-methylase UbiE
MPIDQSYNSWASQYDTNENKTRDLEKIAAQKTLGQYKYKHIIELGCGTGKNTEWLSDKAESLVGLDFSSEMLKKAKAKITSSNVEFRFADLTKKWDVPNNSADLISCSLVLEHIDDLNFIFDEAYKKLIPGGLFYICELHPLKQYSGSKARFIEDNNTVELEVFIHCVSDYIDSAITNHFKLLELKEWFDGIEKNEMPRLISFVWEKQ